MADLTGASRSRDRQRPRRHATRAYVLQPARSRVARLATWALSCAVCMAAGAAALRGYEKHVAATTDAACAAPATPAAATTRDSLHDALERAQLALNQETASRATVQKSADALAAEVGRLKAQVLFLQGQSRSRR
jgi:hypothetical protein